MEETDHVYENQSRAPLPEVLKSQYPLSQELKEVKKQRDEEIRRIFTGESDNLSSL